jgi:hypothetical protein
MTNIQILGICSLLLSLIGLVLYSIAGSKPDKDDE